MVGNPYDKRSERENYDLYVKGWKAGNMDRCEGRPAKGSRLWKQAYRYGYSDGFCGR